MILATARVMIKRNEGVRLKAYKDTLGILTVGVGFNLERLDARTRCVRHGIDYDRLVAGRVLLTTAQVDALLEEDLAASLVGLREMLPSFDNMPTLARLVLIDMRFQLGAGGLKKFKNTLAAFRDRDWKRAAEGLRASLAYKQTTHRWETNARSLENIQP